MVTTGAAREELTGAFAVPLSGKNEKGHGVAYRGPISNPLAKVASSREVQCCVHMRGVERGTSRSRLTIATLRQNIPGNDDASLADGGERDHSSHAPHTGPGNNTHEDPGSKARPPRHEQGGDWRRYKHCKRLRKIQNAAFIVLRKCLKRTEPQKNTAKDDATSTQTKAEPVPSPDISAFPNGQRRSEYK